MSAAPPLPPSALCRRSDPGSFGFATTADLADVPGIIGQERAEEAVRFAIGIRRYGYNLYALGTSGMGKHGFVRAFLESARRRRARPSRLGLRPQLRRPAAASCAAAPARARVPSSARTCSGWWRSCAPPSPPCSRARTTARGRSALEAQLSVQGERAFGGLEERARARGVAIVRTPAGVGMAPLRDGEVLEPEAFARLPAPDQERLKAEMAAVQQELQDALVALPREARRHREEVRRLDRLVTATATSHLVDEVRAQWADVPAVLEFLADVEKDVVDNAERLPAAAGRGRAR